MAWKAVVVCCFLARAVAFPSSLGSGGCRAWAEGQPKYMSAGTLADGATLNSGNPNCEVSVTGDLSPSQEYMVTVTAAMNSLMKLYSSDGQCLNPNEAHTQPGHRTGSQTFTWTAPASINSAGIMLYAICASGFSSTMYAAAPVELCPAGGCVEATTVATTVAARESTTMGSQIATVSDIQLAEGMFFSFKPATTADMEDGIEITVTFNNAVWIGFGFSAGDEVSMNGNGAGAELFVCTNGEVRRHFVLFKSISDAGEAVAEGSCTQESGTATMMFKRSLTVSGGGRRLTGHPVTPGTTQQLIWAYDDATDTTVGYHGPINRGGLFIDFATGESPTDPPATTPASSGGSSVATVTDLELTSGMLLSFNPAAMGDSEEGIQISVTFSDSVWIGFGFSAGSGVSMTGNGAGADIYVCSNGEVRRYSSVTVKSISGSGEAVPDSSCTQENGGATMTFTRSLDAGRRLARAVTPGSQQQVIWAYDDASSKSLGYHGTNNRGGLFIDFATGNMGEAFLEGQAALYIHIVLMILAWGFFLPSGVALAACLRRSPNGGAGGVWFSFHWKFQALGFVLTMLGLAAAIWYAEEYSTHFDNGHGVVGIIVCGLAVLQVLGGALRPHKGDPPSMARIAFEKGHKTLGYAAILLGVANVIVGIWLVHDLDFESTVKSLAIALAVIFVLPVVIFAVVSAVLPDNALSRALLGKPNPSSGEAATTIGNSAK